MGCFMTNKCEQFLNESVSRAQVRKATCGDPEPDSCYLLQLSPCDFWIGRQRAHLCRSHRANLIFAELRSSRLRVNLGRSPRPDNFSLRRRRTRSKVTQEFLVCHKDVVFDARGLEILLICL